MKEIRFVEYSPQALLNLRGQLPRGHVAFQTKVSASAIEKLERGEREPSLIVLRKLGEYYNVRFY